MAKDRPLNPVEEACDRVKREREGEITVRSLNPDRDITWESFEDDALRELDMEWDCYD